MKKLVEMTTDEKRQYAKELHKSGESDITHSRWCLSIESNAYFNMGLEKISKAEEILRNL